MGATKISWTDRTANPLVGCSKISAGCVHCYAATAASTGRLRQFPQYQGIAKNGHWTGEVRFVPEVLEQIRKLKKPQRIFMASMSDPFHPKVEDEWLDQIFATIALCPHLTFQMLTKRPEQMLEYLRSAKQRIRRTAVDVGRGNNLSTTEVYETCQFDWPLPNVWLGVSVENQQAADERIPLLLQTPAVVRFLSCEPLLEPINLSRIGGDYFGWNRIDALKGLFYRRTRPTDNGSEWETEAVAQVNWSIVGGESGKNPRACHIDWIRSIVQQCKAAGVPVFCKQVGSVLAKELCSSDHKGGQMQDWPLDIQVRELPSV